MKDGTFTVIPPNMVEFKMSIREADLENDAFRMAFDEVCKTDKPQNAAEELFAWDFFKYGWEAAVRLLNDDEERKQSTPYVDWEKQEVERMVKTLSSEVSDEAKAFYESLSKK